MQSSPSRAACCLRAGFASPSPAPQPSEDIVTANARRLLRKGLEPAHTRHRALEGPQLRSAAAPLFFKANTPHPALGSLLLLRRAQARARPAERPPGLSAGSDGAGRRRGRRRSASKVEWRYSCTLAHRGSPSCCPARTSARARRVGKTKGFPVNRRAALRASPGVARAQDCLPRFSAPLSTAPRSRESFCSLAVCRGRPTGAFWGSWSVPAPRSTALRPRGSNGLRNFGRPS